MSRGQKYFGSRRVRMDLTTLMESACSCLLLPQWFLIAFNCSLVRMCSCFLKSLVIVTSHFHWLFCQAEVAARDAKREKQDRQAELRRKKDEEQEAEEHRKVCLCLSTML